MDFTIIRRSAEITILNYRNMASFKLPIYGFSYIFSNSVGSIYYLL
jgi:hypothetical protein